MAICDINIYIYGIFSMQRDYWRAREKQDVVMQFSWKSLQDLCCPILNQVLTWGLKRTRKGKDPWFIPESLLLMIGDKSATQKQSNAMVLDAFQGAIIYLKLLSV